MSTLTYDTTYYAVYTEADGMLTLKRKSDNKSYTFNDELSSSLLDELRDHKENYNKVLERYAVFLDSDYDDAEKSIYDEIMDEYTNWLRDEQLYEDYYEDLINYGFDNSGNDRY